MSCQQVPTAPAFNPYPRSVQVGEFEVAIGGGIWVAIRAPCVMVFRLCHKFNDFAAYGFSLAIPVHARGRRVPVCDLQISTKPVNCHVLKAVAKRPKVTGSGFIELINTTPACDVSDYH